MAKIGKYDETGAVEINADECVLTGAHVNFENSVRERVIGTPYFYRVTNSQYHRVTDDLRAQWAKEATVNDKPAPVARAAKTVTSEVKE